MQQKKEQASRAPKIVKVRKDSLTGMGGAFQSPLLKKHLKKAHSNIKSTS